MKKTVRTNVDLDREVHRSLKVKAATRGQTIADVLRKMVEFFIEDGTGEAGSESMDKQKNGREKSANTRRGTPYAATRKQ